MILRLETSHQLRAARAMLRWTQNRLAKESGVSIATIKRVELQPRQLDCNKPTRQALEDALVRGGVEFTLNGVQGL